MSAGKASRKWQLAVLMLAVGGALYTRTALSPVQDSVRAAFGLTDGDMALLQGPALALPVFAASIPVGMLVDRRSRVRLLTAVAALEVCATLLTALAANFSMLFLSRCLAGLAPPFAWAAATSLVSDLYEPSRRGRANMAVAIGQVAGASAAFAAAGWLSRWSGEGPKEWRPMLEQMSVPLVAIALLTLLLDEPPRSEIGSADASVGESLRELWQIRRTVLPLLIGTVLVEVADGAVLIWAVPALARRGTLSGPMIEWSVSAALLVSGIAGPIVGGTVADVCQRSGGARRTMLLLSVLAAMSIPAALFPMGATVETVVTLLAAFLTLGMAVSVAVTTLVGIVIPNELRGLCMASLTGSSVLFGLGAAPFAVSVVAACIGGPGALGVGLATVCIGASAVCMASFLTGSRMLPGAPR